MPFTKYFINIYAYTRYFFVSFYELYSDKTPLKKLTFFCESYYIEIFFTTTQYFLHFKTIKIFSVVVKT